MSAPLLAFIGFFALAPAAVLLVHSFWSSAAFQLDKSWTLDSYTAVLENDTFWTVTFRGIGIAIVAAAIALAISLPVAYVLRFRARGNVLFFLIILAALSSYLVRVYAWRTMLGREGVVNKALESLGLIDQPLSFLLFNRTAVVLTLVHILIPFNVLILRAALANVTPEQVQAARDLGASSLRAVWSVVIPIAGAGMRGALLFSFVLSLGDYITPQLVGGTNGSMPGVLIMNELVLTGNVPRGAAMTFVLLVIPGLLLLAVLLAQRVVAASSRRWDTAARRRVEIPA